MATKKKAPASAVYKVPIDQLMAAVDLRKGDYYTKLSDEDKKGVNTFMAQRWASQVQGTRDVQEQYLIDVNNYSNIDYIATTSEHEELRWKALALVGLGVKLRHEFIPPIGGAKKDKLTAWLIEKFPAMSNDEIELFREINGPEVLAEIATSQNMGNKEFKELFK
jgi:hypothetical protein